MPNAAAASNLLDPDHPDFQRLTPHEATELGQRALEAVGYSGEDARITIDQLVDNSLSGYRFAGLPRVLAIATHRAISEELGLSEQIYTFWPAQDYPNYGKVRIVPGPYQVQAAISALHAEAPTAEATDWRQIAALYDTLALMKPAMVVEVNRAVAIAMAYCASVGLRSLLDLEDQADGYYPYHAARADLLLRTQQREAAAEAYEQALALCSNKAERAYLQRRRAEMLNYPKHSS